MVLLASLTLYLYLSLWFASSISALHSPLSTWLHLSVATSPLKHSPRSLESKEHKNPESETETETQLNGKKKKKQNANRDNSYKNGVLS